LFGYDRVQAHWDEFAIPRSSAANMWSVTIPLRVVIVNHFPVLHMKSAWLLSIFAKQMGVALVGWAMLIQQMIQLI